MLLLERLNFPRVSGSGAEKKWGGIGPLKLLYENLRCYNFSLLFGSADRHL
jgi:hypothetical protein